MDALFEEIFDMDDIVVEYHHEKGGIVVTNKEADHPAQGFAQDRTVTEAAVSSGEAIRTKVQRGGSYAGERDYKPDHALPNGNLEESPRRRLERLLRTPTLDLSTSRDIEVATPYMPNRSRSMSPHDIQSSSPNNFPRVQVRKAETIRNAVNHVNEDSVLNPPLNFGAFHIPGLGRSGSGSPGGGDGGGSDVPDSMTVKGLYQSKLERDFDVNKELLEIAESGDHVRLEDFLKEQAGIVDVNYKQLYKYHAYYPDILIPDAKTPLTCAVRSQSLPCVELLIKDGSKVTTNHKEILYDPEHALSLSPLAASVKLRHRKIAEFLVEKGADIRITFILLSNVFDPFLFKIFEASNVEALSPSSGGLSRSKPPDLDGLKELIHPDILCAWPSPIDIAFKVSKAFEFLKGIKEEYRKDFAALAAQCDKFAYDFLSQCQTPNEARDLLGRAGFLDEAMDANKKEFVAHPLSQQLLKMEWQKGDATYLGTATFNGWFYAFIRVLVLPIVVPFSFIKFLLSNESIKKANVTRTIEIINVPVYCFMVHATSSCLFLAFILWICNTDTSPHISSTEYILWTFVLGRVLVETQQIQRTRMTEYLSSMWNIVDIISLILFIAIIVMRIFFYLAFHYFKGELVLSETGITTFYTYDEWKDNDNFSQIMSELETPKIGSYTENDLLAVINIIYSINSIIACTRLLPLFEASYSLGPLQLTMGGMLADLAKVLCLLVTVILAFSLGTAKLYNSRFFYLYVNGNDSNGTVDSKTINTRLLKCLYNSNAEGHDPALECDFEKNYIDPMLYKSFSSTLMTMFWSLFGLIVPDNIKSRDTICEYFGKLYFGSYMVIAAILLINILIAMINNTYKKVIDNSDVEWKFARASLVQEFKEAHPIIPPFNLATVFFTFIAKSFILTCGSDRAKRAIEHLLIVSGSESEDNVRERNDLGSNKSNKASASSSKLSDADKSQDKLDFDVFEQPKVDILQQVLIRMLVKRYKKSGMSRKMQRMVIAVVGDEVMTLPSTGDIDEEIEDDIKELKMKVGLITKNIEVLSDDVGKKLTLISEKLNTLSGRANTPPQNNLPSPRKLPLPRNNRPRSTNM